MRKITLAIVIAALLAFSFLAIGCGEKKVKKKDEAKKTAGLDTGRELMFPEDHYPHTGMGNEWWYFTGTLNNRQGLKFGYFCTFFQFSGLNQILMNIVDLSKGTNALVEFIDTMGDAKVAKDGLDVDIGGNWQLEYLDDGDFYFKANGENAGLELTVHPVKKYAINGDRGYMEMSSGGTSAYYSCTKMSASGNMYFEGKEMEVQGDSWLDRQWGNWKGEASETYDWFSFRFDDNTELMLYSFRDTDNGEVLSKYNCGTYVDEIGNATSVTDYTVEPIGHEWRSEKTGETYTLKWKVKVPAVDIDVTLEAMVEDQLIVDSTGGTYWEGYCGIVEGNKTGYCYLEMDGYR